jgi:hypothetical protein
MSPLKVYRQFIRRLTITILCTLMNAVVIPVCLERVFGEPRFWLLLGFTAPLLWTLAIMWGHTLAAAAAIRSVVAVAEAQRQGPVKQAA